MKQILFIVIWLKQQIKKNKEFQRALRYYKKHSLIPFKYIKNEEVLDFSDGDYTHIGYCNVIKTDYHENGYKNYDFYKITQEDSEKYNISPTLYYMKTKGDNEKFHYMVFQRTGYLGDDYHGYLLLPMDDKKYWIINFNI